MMHSRLSGHAVRAFAPLVLTLSLVNAACACDKTYIDDTDYNDKANAWNVNDQNLNHCDANVRNLKGGAKHGNPRMLMVDIHFALQRIPNNRICLMAVVRYQAKKGYPFFPEEVRYPTAECYLLNAQYLFPKDLFLWSLMGLNQYLHGEFSAAAKSFEFVIDKQPQDAEAYYNLGLARFALKDYAGAAVAAKKAYEFGYPLPGLKRKLTAVGAW